MIALKPPPEYDHALGIQEWYLCKLCVAEIYTSDLPNISLSDLLFNDICRHHIVMK